MRVIIEIDDDLLNNAQQFTRISDPAALVHHALKQLVQTEAARRLAALGGSDPDARAALRRRQSASDPGAIG